MSPEICRMCGRETEDIYRCEHCQKDLVEKERAGGGRR